MLVKDVEAHAIQSRLPADPKLLLGWVRLKVLALATD
jgi:hypothetical protein